MPVVLVMSDVASDLVGRDVGALHAVPNQIECFRPVTRWAEAVTEAGAIARTLSGGFDLLRTGRPGPIAVSIPNDFLFARVEGERPAGGYGRRPPCHVADIAEAARLLRAAKRPLVLAGGGVIAAGAETELRALARRLDAPVETARLIETLRSALPDDAIVVNDQTGINYWMEWRFPVLAPRTFLYPVGSATLGYAVPAAIGAKIARPERPVLAVAGDGGFMYSVNELATAVKYRLPVVFLVMIYERYGAIKWLQEWMFEGRWGEADLANPDFRALARAFGARGERVTVDTLPRALAEAFTADLPTVLELPMAVEPPWEL